MFNPGLIGGLTTFSLFPSSNMTAAAVWDFTKLQANATNGYGSTSSVPNITALNSVQPGSVSSNLSLSPGITGIAFGSNAGTFIFDGASFLKQATATGELDFTYVNATTANIKFTIIYVANVTDTNVAGAVFGNREPFTVDKGMYIGMNTSTDFVNLSIHNGAASVTSFVSADTVFTAGTWAVYAFRVDMSLADASGRVRFWNGLTTVDATTTGSASAATDNTGAKPFYIAAAGGTVGAQWAGSMKLMAIMNGVETDDWMAATIKRVGRYTGVAV